MLCGIAIAADTESYGKYTYTFTLIDVFWIFYYTHTYKI